MPTCREFLAATAEDGTPKVVLPSRYRGRRRAVEAADELDGAGRRRSRPGYKGLDIGPTDGRASSPRCSRPRPHGLLERPDGSLRDCRRSPRAPRASPRRLRRSTGCRSSVVATLRPRSGRSAWTATALRPHLHRRRSVAGVPRGQDAARRRRPGRGLSGPSDAQAADRGQLEDEPQPSRGHRAGPEDRVQPQATSTSRAVEVVVLPPFVDLRSVQTLVDGDRLLLGYGAQDLSPHDAGAYTGDIGGPHAGASWAAAYVVVGHSERRQYHGEDDAPSRQGAWPPTATSSTPILCVGEQLRHPRGRRPPRPLHGPARRRPGRPARRAGRVDRDRLRAGVGDRHRPGGHPGRRAGGLRRDARAPRRAVQPELAAGVRILYGGSVKAANAAEIMAAARCRRGPGRRRQPGRCGVRGDLRRAGHRRPREPERRRGPSMGAAAT